MLKVYLPKAESTKSSKIAVRESGNGSPQTPALAVGIQEAPRPRCGVQVESRIDVAQIVTSEFGDARQPVTQRTAMDV